MAVARTNDDRVLTLERQCFCCHCSCVAVPNRQCVVVMGVMMVVVMGVMMVVMTTIRPGRPSPITSDPIPRRIGNMSGTVHTLASEQAGGSSG